jgi:hypothetical protein
MTARTLRSWVEVVTRYATGRCARRCFVALLVVIAAYSGAVRIHSFLLTKKIQAVLSGLRQLRVDASTEEQLRKTVPYLVRDSHENHVGSTVERYYGVTISNEDDRWMSWLPWLLYSIWPHPHPDAVVEGDKWSGMGFPSKVTYALACRHLSFHASVSVLDGIVSRTWYDIEPDVFLGWPRSTFIVARSAHSFWRRGGLVSVHSTDDERPEYRFGAVAGGFSMLAGPDTSLGVAYTTDAPRELISHVFQVDLSCFWNIRGCDSVRQVAPLLWADRQIILDATTARLTPKDPCPDRVLAGRVRYLPDLNVALLEAVNSRFEDVNHEGDVFREIVTDYKLKEVIRGDPKGPWTGVRRRQTIPWPLSPNGSIANPVEFRLARAGDSFLYFSGAEFDSCRIIPATPSAVAAVRKAASPTRRSEDDISWMWGRM